MEFALISSAVRFPGPTLDWRVWDELRSPPFFRTPNSCRSRVPRSAGVPVLRRHVRRDPRGGEGAGESCSGNGGGGNWHVGSTGAGGDGHHLAAGTPPGHLPEPPSERWRSRTWQRAMVLARESRLSALPTLSEADAGSCPHVSSPAEAPGLLQMLKCLVQVPVRWRLLGTGTALLWGPR